jgi:two-component system chemotaxis sensor kinase CheA
VLVVIEEGRHRFALLVDELLGQQQFVARPIAAGLQKLPGIAGSAVLGDGRVGLILDPAGLWESAERGAIGGPLSEVLRDPSSS